MGFIKVTSSFEETGAVTAASGSVQTEEGTAAAMGSDPAVLYEDTNRTSEHARHYVRNDGTVKAIVCAEPVNYFDAQDGTWKTADNTFAAQGDGYEIMRGDCKIELSEAGGGMSVRVTRNGKGVSWAFAGRSGAVCATADAEDGLQPALQIAESTTRKSAAVYVNADTGTDLQYRMHGNIVKENIIVRERANDYRYGFALQTEGLKLRLSDNNDSLELYSETLADDGTAVVKVEFVVTCPYMYDEAGVISDDVYYELEETGSGRYAFTVVADSEWINDSGRTFPVTIDPQLVTGESTGIGYAVYYRQIDSSTYLEYGDWQSLSYDFLQVGRSYAQLREYKSELTLNRSLLGLTERAIVKAVLKLRAVSAGACLINGESVVLRTDEWSEIDMTAMLKSEEETVTVAFESRPGNTPIVSIALSEISLEITYIANDATMTPKEDIALAGKMLGRLNLATGELVSVFDDVLPENSVMGLGVRHVVKKSAEDYHVGKNCRLNIDETFTVAGSEYDAAYLYTDGEGEAHCFTDHYWYYDAAGNRQYVEKSEVTVKTDGSLTYNNHRVNVEYTSPLGLKAQTEYADFQKLHLYESRSDEIKQLDEEVKSYEKALAEYVLVDADTLEYAGELSEQDIFNEVEGKMLLSESDAQQLSALKQQAQMAQKQDTVLEKQADLLAATVRINGTIVPASDNSDDTPHINYSESTAGKFNAEEVSVLSSLHEINKFLMRVVTEFALWDATDGNTIISAIRDNIRIYASTFFFPADANLETDNPELAGVTRGSIFSQFRQRNQLVAQLQHIRASIETQNRIIELQQDANEVQTALVSQQMTAIEEKSASCREQAQTYYKEYVNKKNELAEIKEQLPVNFLSDGTYIKGYNHAGKLVAVFDNYDNYAAIEYETYRIDETESGRRIRRIVDNEEHSVVFAYDVASGLLQTITDVYGSRTEYSYDTAGRLTGVSFADAAGLHLTYDDEDTLSGVSGTEQVKAEVQYTGGKAKKIEYTSLCGEISVSGTSGESVGMASTQIAYGWTDGVYSVDITHEDDKVRYRLDDNDNIAARYTERGGVVIAAEEYEYVPYRKNGVKQTNPRSVTKKADGTTLGVNGLDEFTFTAGEIVTDTLDEYNNPAVRSVSGTKLTADGANTKTAETDYTYDESQRAIRERTKTVLTIGDTQKIYYTVSTAAYNANGAVARTETWTEDATGAEMTEYGRDIEETEYDERGRAVCSRKYNSLDASSKFCTRREYDEAGRILSESDDACEHTVRYEYSGSQVRTETYEDGSVTAYGRDTAGTLVSVTASTAEGEENSVRQRFVCELPVEAACGDNTVRYVYDGKRRVKRIGLNGAETYLQYAYGQKTIGGKACDTVTATDAAGATHGRAEDKHGNVLETTFNGAAQTQMTYGKHTYIQQLQDKVTGKTYNYTYDSLDRETSRYSADYGVTTGYNDYGETSGKTIAYYTDGTVTDTYGYEYTYGTDIRRRLKETSVNGYTEKYTYDVSGRRQAVEWTLGGHTYGKRYVYYKAGDCATERVSTVYETKDGITSGKTTYTYDAKGNIVSVNKNGKQIEVYEYDRLDRLVREKKLDKNEEREYTYDDKGNLLRKTADGEVKEYRYEAGSDRMARYGSENCVYDAIGNPTTYRGKTAVWSKGRQLQSITAGAETVTFSYDGRGQRTGKTAGSVTRTYVYDNGTLLREISGTDKTDYLYGSEGITGFIVNGTKYLYGKNIFGDIEEIYDAAGNVVGRYSYTAYGEVTVETDVDGIATRNPIRYRGYYYDTETGLYYLKSRYYDPEVGRFITIDDISYLDPDTINGLNLYAYCGNNPVMRVDPNGTSWWSDLWNTIAAIAIVVGVVALVAVTAGGAAIALGASTAMVSAIAMGATVGGLVAGAMEIGTQLINNGYGNIDLGTVAIESFIGAAYGAISGAMNATVSAGVRLGMRGALVGLSGLGTALYGIKEGNSFGTIMKDVGISMAASIAMQAIMVGWDFRKGNLSTTVRELLLLDKGLFGTKKLVEIGLIAMGKNMWRRRGFWINLAF